MGILDWLFGKKNGKSVESRAHRLREDAAGSVPGTDHFVTFPGGGSGPRMQSWSQIGASLGVQVVDDRALALNRSGNSARESRDFNGAILLYKQALGLEPRFVDAHSGLATAYRKIGKIDEAIKATRTAIECVPGYLVDNDQVQAQYINLQNAILDRGFRPAALDEFRAEAQGLPQSSGYHCALGLIHWRVGNPRDARAEFQEVLKFVQTGTFAAAAREWTEEIDKGRGPPGWKA